MLGGDCLRTFGTTHVYVKHFNQFEKLETRNQEFGS